MTESTSATAALLRTVSWGCCSVCIRNGCIRLQEQIIRTYTPAVAKIYASNGTSIALSLTQAYHIVTQYAFKLLSTSPMHDSGLLVSRGPLHVVWLEALARHGANAV